jgi:O-antigen/teichoic acid export membrane protein
MEYYQYLSISALIIISSIWFNNLIAVLQADLRSALFSFYTITNSVLKLGVSLLLVICVERSIVNLLLGNFLSFSALIIPMLFLLVSKDHSGKSNIKSDAKKESTASLLLFSKQFFSYGFPMVGWFLGAELLSIADRYLIQIFRSAQEVGIYSCNYNLVSSAISFVALPLITAAHPLIMKVGSNLDNNKEHVQNVIKTFSRYYVILSFPIISYFFAFSKEFVNVFLGIEYRVGHIILPVVLFGIFVWYFAMFGHKGLELREKTNIMFIYVLICTIVKVILNVIFVPRYGYLAAAITTTICFLLYPTLVYFGTKSDIRWLIPWDSVLKTGVASLALIILFLLLKLFRFSLLCTLIIAVLVTLFTYPTFLYLIGEVKHYEIIYLNKMKVRVVGYFKKFTT